MHIKKTISFMLLVAILFLSDAGLSSERATISIPQNMSKLQDTTSVFYGKILVPQSIACTLEPVVVGVIFTMLLNIAILLGRFLIFRPTEILFGFDYGRTLTGAGNLMIISISLLEIFR